MFGPGYEVGCPTCSSSADAVNGVVSHLNASGATMVYVSSASPEKLQGYKRRMGWSFPWVSSEGSDFNFDFGLSRTAEQTRAEIEPWLAAGTPQILNHMMQATGADAVSYMSEAPGFSAFVLDQGIVYHTYSTTARGLEFLMGYYPILDRAPNGRDENGPAELWIRRHDEYGT